jgi:hypothetical protein
VKCAKSITLLVRIADFAKSVMSARERQTMNNEYLKAKFDLCIDQAEKDIQEQDVTNAIKNLERANTAMARLFGLEEDGE